MASLIITSATVVSVEDDEAAEIAAMNDVDREERLRDLFREAMAEDSFGIVSHEIEED